mgnify:CR=1 FL=1
MNVKRIILAAMAMVAVASFVDPVAAQSTLQAATAGWFSDALNFISDHADEIAAIADAILEML